jgi:hypothetical protein
MYKSGKTTMEVVCGILTALAALLGAGFMIYMEFRSSMIAVVDGGHWKAPQSVVTDIEAMDVNEMTARDPNRMTAEHANETCSLLIVKIHNPWGNKTENTKMSVPTALHWEVLWDEGKEKEQYSDTTLISLPEIQGGRHVDVKVWAACMPIRSYIKKIEITQDRGRPARKDIRTPVWSCVQCLSQHMSKVVKICAFVLFIGLLALIYILIRRRYFPSGSTTSGSI